MAGYNPYSFIVIGLDPSEDIVGLTGSLYRQGEAPLFLFGVKCKGTPAKAKDDTDTALFGRILEVKRLLDRAMREHEPILFAQEVTHPTSLAFESPQPVNAAWGLRPATRAVHNSVGGYVSLSCFAAFRKIRVGTMDASHVYGNGKLPTPAKKEAAIGWANDTFRQSLPHPLQTGDDAIADALVAAEMGSRAIANEILIARASGVDATKKRRTK